MEDEDNALEQVEKEDSPLFQAIKRGESENDILAIIDCDTCATQQRDSNGNYPLHEACRFCREDPHGLVIMKLLDLFPQAAKEKFHYGDGYDYYNDHYPLHMACRELCDDVVLKLIEVYPDAVRLYNKEMSMDYPLHIACYKSRLDRVIMKLLQVFPEAAASRSVLFDDDDDICENNDEYHRYPLHIACKVGLSKEVIRKLLEIYPRALHERSSEPFGMDKEYPLGWALAHNMPLDVIKLLVTTDPSILQQTDDHGFTTLHDTSCLNRVSLVELLLQFPDLPINARTMYGGYTPLHYACCHGHPGIEAAVALILEHPYVDVNAIDNHGNSALHFIILGHEFNFIHLLLSHPSIIIDQKNDKNQTPLDLINKQITELTNHDDDDDNNKASLPCLMEIRKLLQDFPKKRKWQSYEYFHQNFEDWTSRKKK